MINRFPNFHPCTESLQFSVNDYLALVVTLLIRSVRHLKQILSICSCACNSWLSIDIWV